MQMGMQRSGVPGSSPGWRYKLRVALVSQGGLKITEMYCLLLLEAGSQESKRCQGHVPPEGSREDSFLVSSWLLVVADKA